MITLTFSEPVKFQSYTNFTLFMKVNINGPSSPYSFKYSIIDQLVENQSFTQMQIRIYDLGTNLNGGGREKIEIWWLNLEVIQDLSNNTLSEGKITGDLNQYEHVSSGAEATISSGGSSIKYTLISMFTINLLLKFVISSSAALMWSLIHVLQVFRYILMMNIHMPKLIGTLMKYLVVVIGEVDELQEIVPDILNDYILDSEDLSHNMTIYPRFEESGYETPYLNNLHGKQFLIFAVIILIVMPMIYCMKNLFKNVKYFGKKLAVTWSDFFWNAPVRTFVELYIEISLGFFMHTLNIRFKSPTGVVAT